MGARGDVGAGTGRRHLRELHRRRGCGTGSVLVPAGHLSAAGPTEERIRPHQSVPAEPEHRPLGLTTASCSSRRHIAGPVVFSFGYHAGGGAIAPPPPLPLIPDSTLEAAAPSSAEALRVRGAARS